eukprot:PhM_4_TR16101/c0_g1_i1/m.77589
MLGVIPATATPTTTTIVVVVAAAVLAAFAVGHGLTAELRSVAPSRIRNGLATDAEVLVVRHVKLPVPRHGVARVFVALVGLHGEAVLGTGAQLGRPSVVIIIVVVVGGAERAAGLNGGRVINGHRGVAENAALCVLVLFGGRADRQRWCDAGCLGAAFISLVVITVFLSVVVVVLALDRHRSTHICCTCGMIIITAGALRDALDDGVRVLGNERVVVVVVILRRAVVIVAVLSRSLVVVVATGRWLELLLLLLLLLWFLWLLLLLLWQNSARHNADVGWWRRVAAAAAGGCRRRHSRRCCGLCNRRIVIIRLHHFLKDTFF